MKVKGPNKKTIKGPKKEDQGPVKHATREQWLQALAKLMAAKFKKIGFPLPEKIRISCGFPSSGSRGGRIAECWSPKASEDSHFEIFIRPDQATREEVTAALVHELAHAALGLEHKHNKKFKSFVTELGLVGPATATTGGIDLWSWVSPLFKKVGPYPHARLNANERPPWKKKQPTEPHLNLRCPKCDYYAKTTRSYLAIGRLICPVDSQILLTWDERKG